MSKVWIGLVLVVMIFSFFGTLNPKEMNFEPKHAYKDMFQYHCVDNALVPNRKDGL